MRPEKPWLVQAEIARLNKLWQRYTTPADVTLDDLGGSIDLARIDLFDAAQLSTVVKVCRQSKSLSDAGRKLFSVSREAKARPNDADRLKKYLAKFNLTWEGL